jgi:hypothetical protein
LKAQAARQVIPVTTAPTLTEEAIDHAAAACQIFGPSDTTLVARRVNLIANDREVARTQRKKCRAKKLEWGYFSGVVQASMKSL